MALTLATGDHLDSAVLLVKAPPFAFSAWYNIVPGQGRRFVSLENTTQNPTDLDFFALGTAIADNSSKLGAWISASTPVQNAQEAQSLATVANVWELGFACFPNTNLRTCTKNGINQGSSTGIFVPAGINRFSIGGRLPNHDRNVGGALAHVCVWSQAPTLIEQFYLGQLFGHPRALANLLEHYKLADRSGAGALGHNLTVTGTTVAATDPDMATCYLGAAIGPQVYTQGTPIIGLNVLAGFDQVNAPFSLTLMQVGASTGSTTATLAAAPTRLIAVTSTALFTAGDYAQVGSATPTRVLAVLIGTGQLLVATDQTVTLGATINRCPVAATTIPGLTLNPSWGGTPTVPQTISNNYFFRATNLVRAVATADTPLFPITVNLLPVPPLFSVAPAVVQQNVAGYVVSVTPNVPCTAYLGAYRRGAPAPTIAQLKASTGAIVPTVVKAILGADTLTIGGLDFPATDLYTVLNDALGDSPLVSLLNQLKAPPAGKVYRPALVSIDPDTYFQGTAQVGDIEETDTVLSPSAAVPVYAADGNDAFTATGRQLRLARLFNATTGAWYLDSAGAQIYQVWYNALPPAFVGGSNVQYVLPQLNAPIVPVPLSNLWQSVTSDTLVITPLDPLDPGLTILNGQLAGQTALGGITSYRLRATDAAGLTTDGVIVLIKGPLLTPRVLFLNYRDAAAQILAAFLVPQINFVDDEGPPNIVLSQDPLPTTSVAANSVVKLQVSQTPPGELPHYGLINHSFQVTPKANGDLDLSDPTGA